MTTWTTDAIIDIVFIFLYAILLLLNIFNCIKHGIRREGGYILLLLVSARIYPAISRTNGSENCGKYFDCLG
jgi:succinate-acetate transporter protein